MNKSFLVSGSGGHGILSIGTILANIFMLDNLFVTFCSSYGAEMRGGAVNCEINTSSREINCFKNEKLDYIITLNQESFDKFISKVKKNGTIIVNSSLIKVQKLRDDINYIFSPFTEDARKLGNIKIANSIALGVVAKLLGGFNIENVKKAYKKVLSNKTELIEKNIEAYLHGFNFIKEEARCP